MWRVRLFDGPVLERVGGEATVRFRSAKVGALLAFLALRLGRRCPREALADALWPEEVDTAVTANRLRVTLASLRRQLEPPGTPFGSVLDVSVPGFVTLRESSVWCDAVEFDRVYAAGDLEDAARLLMGPLLPGLYDEWVRPEQLRFEVIRETLSERSRPSIAEPPPPRKEPSPAHWLPSYLTRFVGRAEELDALLKRLDESRLITLTGPGGIGKTRLAVEAAARWRKEATFVSLEEAEEGRFAESALRALGIQSRDGDPGDMLAEVLRGRPPIVLVIDGAERMVEALAETLPALLAAVPSLTALVTSRQRLEVPGEVAVAVSPLDAPSEEANLSELFSSPAAELFLDRARIAVPDFVLRERHVGEVVAICRRLEGMPLAIELAAARVAVQPLAGIAAALETNAMDLRSRQRGLSARHRSLRAAIQGSVDALPPDLRRFFARLSVFRGGWTADAAAEVGEEPQADDRLEELLVRSLVTVREDEEGDAIRYAFLEPIRAYAQEISSEEESEGVRHRHAARFLALAAAASEDDLRTMRPLDVEEENLRLALERGRGEPTFWSGLAGAMIHAFVRGRHRQALRWIEATQNDLASVPDPAVRFRWRYAACQILPDVGRLDEAETLARAMRTDAETTGDAEGSIHAETILAFLDDLRGHREASLARSARALERARAAGDRPLLEACLSHRSGTLHVGGAPEELAEAEALARELRGLVPPHSRRLALAPLLVAASLWPQGRLEEAVGFFKEAEVSGIRLGTVNEPMYAFVSEAAIALEGGDPEHAARLYGGFLAFQERTGYSLERAQAARPPWIERLASGLRERLGETSFAALVEAGRTAPPAVLAARRANPGKGAGSPLIRR